MDHVKKSLGRQGQMNKMCQYPIELTSVLIAQIDD